MIWCCCGGGGGGGKLARAGKIVAANG